MNEFAAQLVPALAMALLHFLWQGALVGLLAWLALVALRGARPQVRYGVACLALLACAAVPAWYVFDAIANARAPALSHAAMTAQDGGTWRMAMPLPDAGLAATPATLSWIVALWAAGCALLSLRMAMGLLWVQRLREGGSPAATAWQTRMDALASRLGLRPVPLRIVDAGDSPATMGWWRPVVLLPAAVLARMPVDLLEALLAHELAHVRRRDYLVNLLQGVVEVLLFYHPVVWWLSHRIRQERELVADDLAAAALGDPRRMAVALAELDRIAMPRSSFPLVQFAQAAHGGHLMSRIRRLVRPERRSPGSLLALPVLVLLATGAAFYVHAGKVDALATTPASIAQAVAAAASPSPAPLPAPASDPAAATDAARRTSARADREDGYALVREGEDGFSMSGHVADADAIGFASRAIDGDFLWFRRDGKAWIVSDTDTVARVRGAWQPMAPLQSQMRMLQGRMQPHSDRMQALSARMQPLQAQAGTESAEMRAAGAQMQVLSSRMQDIAQEQAALARRMQAGDPQRLQSEMEALDARQRALHREMDRHASILEAEGRRIEASHAPMQALAREMEAEAEPMEAIGKDMEALGARIEQAAKVADGKIRRIIDDAWARGLATPAPTAQ
ncbi:M56 family metallopeptidase [Luteimonas saliphila]|uniref:M56 family metallopeptidase n=1 Tax=Luteimonas saliphila TaxID=2804919 RepID=UPI00192D4AAD|nr:M56 family metallopeptidase [Luteimonas saliphila]